jgi:PAS domain S-box-containing protein
MLSADADSRLDTGEEYFQQSDISLEIVEIIAAAVAVLDPCGVIRVCNRAAARLFGIPADRLIGHQVADYISGDISAIQELWGQLLAQVRLNRAEMELHFSDNRTHLGGVIHVAAPHGRRRADRCGHPCPRSQRIETI